MTPSRINLLIFSICLALFIAYTWITEFTDSSMIAVIVFGVWGLFSIPNARRWYLRHAKFSVPLAMLISGVEVYQSGYSNEVIGTFLMAVILAYPLIFLPAFRFVVFIFQTLRASLVEVKESVDDLSEALDAISSSNKTWLTEEDFYRIFTDDDLQPYRDRGVDLEVSVPLWCKFFRAQRIKDLMAAKRIDLVYEADSKYLEKQRLKEDLHKVVGIGEKKVAALVDRFESRSVMSKASSEEIAAVPGISRANAEEILRCLGS